MVLFMAEHRLIMLAITLASNVKRSNTPLSIDLLTERPQLALKLKVMLRMLRQHRTLPFTLALVLASTADTIMAAIVMLVPRDMLMEQTVALLRVLLSVAVPLLHIQLLMELIHWPTL